MTFTSTLRYGDTGKHGSLGLFCLWVPVSCVQLLGHRHIEGRALFLGVRTAVFEFPDLATGRNMHAPQERGASGPGEISKTGSTSYQG